MKEASGASLPVNQPVQDRPDSMSNMAQLVELIAIARYGMEEDKLGFEAEIRPGTVQIVFGTQNGSYPDLEAFKEAEPAFYASIHKFLSDLQDQTVSSSISIDAENLGIAAASKMDLFNALQMFVEDEALKLSTMDSVAVLKTEEEREWSSAKVSVHIENLAKGCDVLARKHTETFEYLLLNAPTKPYLSVEHFKACLVSRVEAEIPMSLNNLKHQILMEECSGNKMIAHLARRGIYYN